MRVYLDNCVMNRPFDDQSHIRIRLEAEAKLYIQACIREPFNYTEWQRDLWNGKSVGEISKMAMQRRLKQDD